MKPGPAPRRRIAVAVEVSLVWIVAGIITAASLTDRLRDDVDLAHVEADVTGVVDRTLHPSVSSMWLRTQLAGHAPRMPMPRPTIFETAGAARTVHALTNRLREDVDLEHIEADVLSAVGRTFHPASSGFWLRGSQR